MFHFYIVNIWTHLILLIVEVVYIGFHPFIIQLNQTLQSYVIFTFFISMHEHGKPEDVMRQFYWWT